MVSNFVAGSHSIVRPSLPATASMRSISKPSGLVEPSGMDSSGGYAMSETPVSVPSLTRT